MKTMEWAFPTLFLLFAPQALGDPEIKDCTQIAYPDPVAGAVCKLPKGGYLKLTTRHPHVCWRDLQTGLSWCTPGFGSPRELVLNDTYAAAMAACEKLGNGFRLPTKDEAIDAHKAGVLASIPELQTWNAREVFWTSTENAHDKDFGYVFLPKVKDLEHFTQMVFKTKYFNKVCVQEVPRTTTPEPDTQTPRAGTAR